MLQQQSITTISLIPNTMEGLLDDEKVISKIDKKNMRGALHDLSEDMEALLEKLKESEIPLSYEAENVVFAGMGGSAIAGDIVQYWLQDNIELPIHVVRGSLLPRWVGKGSVVVAVSYSGNTRETLSAFEEARRRGAQLVAISSGGRLEELCISHHIPHIKVRSGMQPRAAIAHLFVSSLIPLRSLGLIREREIEELRDSVRVTQELREEIDAGVPLENNRAKRTAMMISGKTPYIYASGAMLPVARRWVTQLNENAKSLATYFEVPECNHNHVVAIAHEKEKLASIAPVFLRDEEDPFLRINMDYLAEIYQRNSIEIIEVRPQGKSRVARMFYALYFGDYVSYYLAILRGIDPTPVDAIAELKRRLSAL